MKPKFYGKTICLDLSHSTPYKQKKSLIDTLISNGGRVSFVLNQKVNLLVKNDRLDLDSYKCRTAFRMGIPVVDVNYVNDLIRIADSDKAVANAIKIADYEIQNKDHLENFKKGIIAKSKPTLVRFKRIYLQYLSIYIIFGK